MTEVIDWISANSAFILTTIGLAFAAATSAATFLTYSYTRRFEEIEKKVADATEKLAESNEKLAHVTELLEVPDDADPRIDFVPGPDDQFFAMRKDLPELRRLRQRLDELAASRDDYHEDIDLHLAYRGRPDVRFERLEPLKDEGGASVGVWYATNRNRTGSEELNDYYGSERDNLKYGLAHVRIPPTHRRGILERPPHFWKIEWKEDYKKHVVVTDLTQYDEEAEFFSDVARDLADEDEKKRPALVFIHGFNVTFADALRRTAQVAYDLFKISENRGAARLTVMPFLFSWPSEGKTVLYTHDINNSEASATHLVQFLQDLKTRSGVSSIIIMAHSMGNRALSYALQNLGSAMNQHSQPPVQEIIMAAPDVDTEIFSRMAPTVFRTGQRTTIYASDTDRALKLSRAVNGYQRLGDATNITILAGADTIDATNVGEDMLAHSYYGEPTMLNDLFYLIKGMTPPNRYGLETRGTPPRVYWAFKH